MSSEKSKILVAYFSHSGNTRTVAEDIQKIVGGDIFEIKTIEAYPRDYNTVVDQAKRELNSGRRPALSSKLENGKSYDTIFLGYPNWWSTLPMPLFTFLEENDFSGQTIAPFCTHGGGGLGRGVNDITKLAPEAKILKALEVNGSRANKAQSAVREWLRGLDLAD